MRRLWTLVAALTLVIALGSASPALAAADGPSLTVTAPSTAIAGQQATIEIQLNDGTPPYEIVRLQKFNGTTWDDVASKQVDDNGHAVVSTAVVVGNNALRAVYGPQDTQLVKEFSINGTPPAPERTAAVISLTLPKTVVDEKTAKLAIIWQNKTAVKQSGTVKIERHSRTSKTWQPYKSVKVVNGSATVNVGPRVSTYYRVLTPQTDTALKGISKPVYIKNLPPGAVVKFPKKAPKPKIKLPAQPRATAPGAHAVIHKLSKKVFASMKGRSWHKGCISPKSLRLINVNYWGFDGYRRRGEIVVNKSVAKNVAGIFTDLYAKRVPIRAMYRVDRFGYSKRVKGANDYKSMEADNTSAFNCRNVVGRPGVRSPHASGRSIDINTWENPYKVGGKVYPNSYWAKQKSPKSVVWRSKKHPVVKIFAKHGYRWLGSFDTQHFQKR